MYGAVKQQSMQKGGKMAGSVSGNLLDYKINMLRNNQS